MPAVENRLLRALSEKDRAQLLPALEHVELSRAQVLESPRTPVTHAFFVERGLASVVSQSPRRELGVGVVGNDGMTGLDIVLDARRSANETVVQAAGSALRIEAGKLHQAQMESATLRNMLLRYVHVFMIQTSQTALTNGHAGMEERLARWILMSHDRFEGNDLTVTHEFISLMLGVRRPGITEAMHVLEGRKLIRSTRDNIHVVDRQGLIGLAAESYGVCETEYERLIGECRQHNRPPEPGASR